jgi:hypothetical protein
LKADTRANSEAYSEIPYATEQGNYFGRTGNSGSGTRNFPGQIRADEVFGTHNLTQDVRTQHSIIWHQINGVQFSNYSSISEVLGETEGEYAAGNRIA